jgi:hypothetical protein
MKRAVLAFAVIVIGWVCHCAPAETIHGHFGLDKDAVVQVTVSHAPKGDFDAANVASQVTSNKKLIAELVDALKQLPASGTSYKKFPNDIEQLRIELKTKSGQVHRLTVYGIKLRSPQTKGGSFYGKPETEKYEKQLLELVWQRVIPAQVADYVEKWRPMSAHATWSLGNACSNWGALVG